jgi:peptidoglycan hydrolase-like protein with peptidoglycan-binding domain
VDGNFGAQTAANVRAFQSSAGLAPDGEAGSLTWQSLVS